MVSKRCMFLGVFRFVKNMKFFIKGGICISSVFLGHFIVCGGSSLVELTVHDDSATLAATINTNVF